MPSGEGPGDFTLYDEHRLTFTRPVPLSMPPTIRAADNCSGVWINMAVSVVVPPDVGCCMPMSDNSVPFHFQEKRAMSPARWRRQMRRYAELGSWPRELGIRPRPRNAKWHGELKKVGAAAAARPATETAAGATESAAAARPATETAAAARPATDAAKPARRILPPALVRAICNPINKAKGRYVCYRTTFFRHRLQKLMLHSASVFCIICNRHSFATHLDKLYYFEFYLQSEQ